MIGELAEESLGTNLGPKVDIDTVLFVIHVVCNQIFCMLNFSPNWKSIVREKSRDFMFDFVLPLMSSIYHT